ncbi:maleylpyruvate isomerase family mycothiol-dependent enzyme [Antribacter gilvus]|uniref:maleylpyruvate isomerase family mycothiol-dependent enzyme n=1 Tax=Antribacter gilvus TaxID=2304675 RepID=UPI000F77BD27|nr:maleylpyruvate isomerase family mycothiol-dependent enzyme [Antribacter gilvus]
MTVETPAGRGAGSPSTIAYLSVLADLQEQFRTGVLTADPAARVPACGDWTVRELVEHLAEIHDWAAARARGEEDPEPPALDSGLDAQGLASHYNVHAAVVRETFGALGPHAMGRVLGGLTPDGTGPVTFWHRRQTHETLVHLHDLRAAEAGAPALGLAPAAPEVWSDTVDEVVAVLQPRQVALGRMAPLRHPVALAATDVPGAPVWVLGASGDRAEEVAPDVLVTGTAEGLALMLWRRLTPEEAGVTIEGDHRDLTHALAEHIIP